MSSMNRRTWTLAACATSLILLAGCKSNPECPPAGEVAPVVQALDDVASWTADDRVKLSMALDKSGAEAAGGAFSAEQLLTAATGRIADRLAAVVDRKSAAITGEDLKEAFIQAASSQRVPPDRAAALYSDSPRVINVTIMKSIVATSGEPQREALERTRRCAK